MKKSGKLFLILGIAAAAAIIFAVVTVVIMLNSSDGGGHFGNESPIGGDWRTWRGYTDDYKLSDDFTVTFSAFTGDDGESKCYAVYETQNGIRLGYIKILPPDCEQITKYEGKDFELKDCNSDGILDIGVPLNDGRRLWYNLSRPENGYAVGYQFPQIINE